MTKGSIIWIATLTTSAASAAFAALGQPGLASISLGLALCAANDLFFILAIRVLSTRIATLWPKATALLLPLAWLGKQAVLFAGAYLLLSQTHLPVAPFALAVAAYQTVRVVVMMIWPEQYAQCFAHEPSVAKHALTGGNAE
ncbi:MAG: hypothetical protein QHH80_01400 [Anaerolineae bacterium]|nr:hypothetical protein [Anaerolineae bacterium]